MLTAREAIEQLSKVKNLDAVLCLCVDGLTYSPIESLIDRTCQPEADGNIGNALLTLDPQSEVAIALNRLAEIVGD